MVKIMEHRCDKCKTYNPEGDHNTMCATRRFCPGMAETLEERQRRYERIYRKEIEYLLGSHFGSGKLRGRLVETVINNIEYIGIYAYNYHDKQLYLYNSRVESLAVNIGDVSYVKEL